MHPAQAQAILSLLDSIRAMVLASGGQQPQQQNMHQRQMPPQQFRQAPQQPQQYLDPREEALLDQALGVSPDGQWAQPGGQVGQAPRQQFAPEYAQPPSQYQQPGHPQPPGYFPNNMGQQQQPMGPSPYLQAPPAMPPLAPSESAFSKMMQSAIQNGAPTTADFFNQPG